MIRRRTFMSTLTVALLASSNDAHGQRAKRPVVAWLSGGGTLDVPSFLAGLRPYGYVPGQTVSFDRYQAPPGTGDVSGVVARLISTNPNVILASNAASLDAMTRATQTIPVVGVDLESDPVARGWIPRLARPGGNVTGVFLDIPELCGRQLQLLRDVRPGLSRVAVLGVPGVNEVQLRAIETAAKSGGLTVHPAFVKALDEVTKVVADAARQGATGLVLLTSPILNGGLRAIADAALKHRLVSVCPAAPEFAEAGGLVGYGPSSFDVFRRAGDYVGRILKGATVGGLPVQRPKTLLVLNVQTAKALGVTLPTPLVERADRVIQ